MQPADFILHCKLGDLKSYYRPPNTTIILAGVAALPSLLTIIYIYIIIYMLLGLLLLLLFIY